MLLVYSFCFLFCSFFVFSPFESISSSFFFQSYLQVMAQRSLAIASEGFWRAASLRLAEREASRRGKPGNLQSKRRLMKKIAAQWFTISYQHCFTAWRKYTANKRRPVISRETKANEREFKIGMQEDLSLTISRGNTPSTAGGGGGVGSNISSPLSMSRAQTPGTATPMNVLKESDNDDSTGLSIDDDRTSQITSANDDMVKEKEEEDRVNDADDEKETKAVTIKAMDQRDISVLSANSRRSSAALSRRNSTASNDIYRIPTALLGIFSNSEVSQFFFF